MDPATYRRYMTQNFLEFRLENWDDTLGDIGIRQYFQESFEYLWKCGFRRLTADDLPSTLDEYVNYNYTLGWMEGSRPTVPVHFFDHPSICAAAGATHRRECFSILSRKIRDDYSIEDRTEFGRCSKLSEQLSDEDIDIIWELMNSTTSREASQVGEPAEISSGSGQAQNAGGASSPSGLSGMPSGASDRRSPQPLRRSPQPTISSGQRSRSVQEQDRQRTPKRAADLGDKITSVSGVSMGRISSRRYRDERETKKEEEGRGTSGRYKGTSDSPFRFIRPADEAERGVGVQEDLLTALVGKDRAAAQRPLENCSIQKEHDDKLSAKMRKAMRPDGSHRYSRFCGCGVCAKYRKYYLEH